MDIIVLRELTGGIYFGEPRGIEDLSDGQRRGVNTEVYTSNEIIRLGRVGFEIAEMRKLFIRRKGKCDGVRNAMEEEINKLKEKNLQKLIFIICMQIIVLCN